MQAENTLPEPNHAVDEQITLKQYTATLIFGTSLFLGVIGNLFFYQNTAGVNIPLYILLTLLMAFALLTYFNRLIVPKHAIFALPAFLFAGFLSLYTAPQLVFFNVVMMGGSLFLLLRYVSTPTFLEGSWLAPVFSAIQTAMLGWIDAPITVGLDTMGWLQKVKFNSRESQVTAAIVRGLLLTIPILIVFGVLLGSADVVFGDLLSDSFSWMVPENLESLITQLFIIGAFTWVVMTGFKLMLLGPLMVPRTATPATQGLPFGLSMIETGMILGSVDVLFAAFVVIQARYLFGGEANISERGYTYSEYARRGFFELLAVSFMTMILLLVLDRITRRANGRENLFRGLASLLVGLTLIILIASFRRLVLYEEAYGFTRLRVMTQVYEVWLALLFGVLLVELLHIRRGVFWIACLVAAFGFVFTLNIMNMDAFIASRNIHRFEETGKLDAEYLTELSSDAVPVVVDLLENPRLEEIDRNLLLDRLGEKLYELDDDRKHSNDLGFHFGKDRARDALDKYRAELEPYYEPAYRYTWD